MEINSTHRTVSILELFGAHFTVLLSILTLFSLLCAITSICGYNAAFDLSLVWLFQYTDFINVALSIGSISILFILILLIVGMILYRIVSYVRQDLRQASFVLVVAIFAGYFYLIVYQNTKMDDPDRQIALFALLTLVGLAIPSSYLLSATEGFNVGNILFSTVSFLFTLFMLSLLLGFHTRLKAPYDLVVTTDDRIYKDVMLAEILSRYTVIANHNSNIILNTTNVKSIERKF